MITLEAIRRTPEPHEIIHYLISKGYSFQLKQINPSKEFFNKVYKKPKDHDTNKIYVPLINNDESLRDTHTSICLSMISLQEKVDTYTLWKAITGED